MSYSQKINESQERARSVNIANRILDLMDKLRLSNEQGPKRRWIWELLQNAKDVCKSPDGVNIEIKVIEYGNVTYLDFLHDGAPFSVDNITFLIEQVSTKERNEQYNDSPKTTGKFGTGFLTTHLLSEVVEVEGVVKEPDLPYRKFQLLLDRSGRQMEDILKSVTNSLSMLSTLDRQPNIENYNSAAFNTRFRYFLDEHGKEVMTAGLEDLKTSLPYTMAFNPLIKSVRLAHENTIYQRIRTQTLSGGSQIVTINKRNLITNTDNLIDLVICHDELVTIAREIVAINNKIIVVPFKKNQPRLFCDFPLVGTESFHYPAILNSSHFFPTEPRDGVYLTDQHDERILTNKSLMERSTDHTTGHF